MFALIDSPVQPVNNSHMDFDENLPRRKKDLLADLEREDLDPLSVDELRARIAALHAEITRTEARINFAANHKASADALFKKGG